MGGASFNPMGQISPCGQSSLDQHRYSQEMA